MFCSAEGTGGRRGFGFLLIPSSVVNGGAVAGTMGGFRSHNDIDQLLHGMGNITLVHTVPISMTYTMQLYQNRISSKVSNLPVSRVQYLEL